MTSLTGVNVIQVSIILEDLRVQLTTSTSTIKVTSSPLLCQLCTQLTSLLASLYKSLGIGSKTILALAAVYGTVAFTSNALTTKYLTDQWGRRKYVPFLSPAPLPKSDKRDQEAKKYFPG